MDADARQDHETGALYDHAIMELEQYRARTSRRYWMTLVAASVLTLLLAIGVIVQQHDNRDRIRDADALTTRVERIANRNAAFIDAYAVRLSLQSEKVCSESNRGSACRALFERLVEDITRTQTRRMACGAVRALPRTRDVRTLLRACEAR